MADSDIPGEKPEGKHFYNDPITADNIETFLKDNQKVKGHLVSLDETRLVFIGEHDDIPDCWCIQFRNEEGVDTRLKLSKEAMATLVQLYDKPNKGTQTFP